MAREQSLAVAGYFPMPAQLMTPVCRYLQRGYGDGMSHIIDTCAGEGKALLALQSHLGAGAVARAIELHEGRAAQAGALLGEEMVLRADALTGVDVSAGAFGLLWLNPPYHLGQFELEFLMAHTPLLHSGGVLCLVVPQPALALLGEYVASWYTTVTCYRFPEPEYRAYKQVVLFGERKEAPLGNAALAERIRGYAEPGGEMPTLGAYGYRYIVPHTKGPAVFQLRTPEDVPAAGGLWDDSEVTKRLARARAHVAAPAHAARADTWPSSASVACYATPCCTTGMGRPTWSRGAPSRPRTCAPGRRRAPTVGPSACASRARVPRRASRCSTCRRASGSTCAPAPEARAARWPGSSRSSAPV